MSSSRGPRQLQVKGDLRCLTGLSWLSEGWTVAVAVSTSNNWSTLTWKSTELLEPQTWQFKTPMLCPLLVCTLFNVLGWAGGEGTNVVPFSTKTGYYPFDASTFIVGAMDGNIHGLEGLISALPLQVWVLQQEKSFGLLVLEAICTPRPITQSYLAWTTVCTCTHSMGWR